MAMLVLGRVRVGQMPRLNQEEKTEGIIKGPW